MLSPQTTSEHPTAEHQETPATGPSDEKPIQLRAQPTASAGLNRAKCPVLAWSYSEPFQVYSAKKFPGVIESTPLSRSFAAQGIKIPIRKEGKADKNEDDED